MNKPERKRKLPLLEVFFIFLIRLKTGMFLFDLSERFDVCFSLSETFTTRINFLCHGLPLCFPFPSQKLVRKYLPKSFDGTEIYLIVLEIVMWLLAHRAFSIAFLVQFP